jgi:hypothetical protein
MIQVTQYQTQVSLLLAVLHDNDHSARANVARLDAAELEQLGLACQAVNSLCEEAYALRSLAHDQP